MRLANSLSEFMFGPDVVYEERTAVKMLADAGFDAIAVSLSQIMRDDHRYSQPDYLHHAQASRTWANDLGISFNITHSLFPVYKQGQAAFNQKAWEKLLRSLEITAKLGATHMVVHPFALGYGNAWEENVRFFDALTPYIRNSGIKVALENSFWLTAARVKQHRELHGTKVVMREEIVPPARMNLVGGFSRDLLALVEALDPDCFAVCLDIGHCVLLREEPEDAIRTLGKRLECLHVHDNDGEQDLHAIPYDRVGCIDWDRVTAALRDVHYTGDFTLEVDQLTPKLPPPLQLDGLRFLERTGRYLMNKVLAD